MDRAAERSVWTAPPRLVGLLSFLGVGAWFVPLLDLPDFVGTGLRALVPILLVLAVVPAVAALVGRWPAPGKRWTDHHRLAVVMGALSAGTLRGFFYVTADSPADRAGQAFASAAALLIVSALSKRCARGYRTPRAPMTKPRRSRSS